MRLMESVRVRIKLVVFVVACLLAAGICMPIQTYATPYGVGTYNNCGYQQCDTPAPTEVTLPSGLEIAVNLTDGQVIPLSGYTVTVTPLNGQGETFKQVSFYVDDQLTQDAVVPDDTGTASWRWKPAREGTAVVKIIVLDTNDTPVTKQFAVEVRDKTETGAGSGNGTNQPSSGPQTPDKQASGPERFVHTITEGAKQVIRSLPRPVVYSFPYILLVLLGVNLIVLLFQVKRELSAYHILLARLVQLEAVDQGKKTFLELVSHYFRTPLTVLSGGIDMLQPNEVPAEVANRLKAASTRLRSTVEQLISQAVAGQRAAQPVVSRQNKLSRYIALSIPVVLIGLITFGFTYTTSRAGSFTITQLNIGVQVVTYVLLALATYQVFRRMHLHKHEAALTRQVIEQQETALQVRDGLIQSSAAMIAADVRELDNILSTLPDTKSVSFIRNGQGRFHELAAKFTLVAGLRGTHSQNPPAAVTLDDLLAFGRGHLQAQLDKKQLQLVTPVNGASFMVRDKELVAYVLGGILDNAAAFSPERSNIEIGLDNTPDGVVLSVTDHGPGIPTDQQAALFTPFSKASGALTFDHEGIGLGLYTDKLIMEYIGGNISLTSEPGRTVVMLQMPV